MVESLQKSFDIMTFDRMMFYKKNKQKKKLDKFFGIIYKISSTLIYIYWIYVIYVDEYK